MPTKYIRWLVILILLLIAVFISIAVSISVGELSISLFDIPDIFEKGDTSMEYTILKKIRLPRIFLGFAVGGALSLAGAILQGIYRNPLVEPYTLGISGGAALGVTVAIVFGLTVSVGAMVLPISGFLGSLVIIFLVYTFSIQKGRLNTNNMLLTGVMISFIASSIMMLLMAITSSENLHGIIFWIMGSLDEPNINLIYFAFISSITGLIFSFFFVKQLNALRLGEEKAMQLGINSELAIRVLFIISSLLTGISVAVAGIIGFVGLIIPHLMRLFVGNDYRILLLSSFLGGGTFLILCDTLARVIITPNELPVGVITGIIGGAIFVVILRKLNTRM
ncbi:MAG: iron ABC transporter permease [Bacteroidetes bacterium]|nr:MAG: iron ABC transporter permease [Bacteroidota bacterium]